ncbi:MAG: peptidase T [Treponemataceae bacterium]|nr:peptidase T [Treponemataceae bacterium]
MKLFSSDTELQNRLLDRFIRYVKVWTESSTENADNGIMPSTERQRPFAEALAEELKGIGLTDVCVTPECYVYGALPASDGLDGVPPFCLLAHLDTADEVSGRDVRPIIHTGYDGTRIDLQGGVSLDCAEDSCLALAAKQRDTLITSDGTTLLGADDKAGIAEIVSALEYLSEHTQAAHGKIEVVFSPDEETGHGMDHVPLNLISSKYAYTVDGGHLGQLETECFNASRAAIRFTGKSAHTGDARKNGMVNAACTAARFIESLPAAERPETTDGRAGFYAVMECRGAIESASVTLLLRDFTEAGMNRRIETVRMLAVACAHASGASVQVEIKEQYKNMKAALDAAPETVSLLERACRNAGVEPEYTPIRGGTDGSKLTEMGIPTPNIFTGGHNFHSRAEWASLQQMSAAADVLVNLAVLAADKK